MYRKEDGQNKGLHALEKAQAALAGAAESVGLNDQEAVVKLCKEVRKELYKERYREKD